MKKLYLFLTGLMIALGVHAETQTQVIYTWSSTGSTAAKITQSGGEVSLQNALSTTSNCINVKASGGSNYASYYSLVLRGKHNYMDDEDATNFSNYLQIALTDELKEGDKIRIYGCFSSSDDETVRSIYMRFENGSEYYGEEGDTYWTNIYRKKASAVTINYYDYEVPADEEGTNNIYLTRTDESETNIYITKIEITRQVKVQESETLNFTTGYLNTFCYPYTVTADGDSKFYTFEGIQDGHIYGTEVTGDLQAGEPYLCIPASSTITFNRTDLTESSKTEGSHNGMYANYGNSFNPIGSKYMILTTKGLQYCSDNNGNFVKQYGCYFLSSEVLGTSVSAKAVPIFNQADLVEPEDAATGINVAENAVNTDKVVYNLNGQRVSNMQKGKIYIINGKKVAAK